ncbi:MAG: hypothetical protein Q8O38_16625 [Sulfurimicrobium sp.]|nr:hypothetical protein [Sulfurimicrobium sp.]
MAHAPNLESLLKSFATDGSGIVQFDADGSIGIDSSMIDTILTEPRLAIHARRLGIRVAVPGITDAPESRILLDALAHDLDATEELHALLLEIVGAVRSSQTEPPETMLFKSLSLLHILPFVPSLSVGAVACLHEPDDLRRRAETASCLTASIRAGSLKAHHQDGVLVIQRADYSAYPGRLKGSMFLSAWTGDLPTAIWD